MSANPRKSSRLIARLSRDSGSARRAELAPSYADGDVSPTAQKRYLGTLLEHQLGAARGDTQAKDRLRHTRSRLRAKGLFALVDAVERATTPDVIQILAQLGDDDRDAVLDEYVTIVVEHRLQSATSLTLSFRAVLFSRCARTMAARVLAGTASKEDKRLGDRWAASSRLDMLQSLAIAENVRTVENPIARAQRERQEAAERKLRAEEYEAELVARRAALEAEVKQAAPVAPEFTKPATSAEWLRGR